ncbi:phosphotransferase family protein [Shewanella ulleungensis]|jgi:aminoglycoside phosphotransferase (APT) family kinase protein|uniref:Aminoglycoside phosphotransferase n=1 Tax=Shewanella ulleungensis TaxID=2282699 RepID=A0ABQ2QDV2_9GAMM|nr:phosphotransferase family protein [Shewanella ulleungensis]MCL1149029.1 phosphotransferase family protein [Shewanella ulleungensis]GGP74045.1 aminoglycoside phosphotransferase [Shewanella ulleungensis]
MNQQYLDKAKSVRTGEELDPDVISAWLTQHIGGLEGDLKITQYTGGASNWTYCLTYDNCELILRRAPMGTKAKGAHDMGREYRLQQALKPVYPYVPAMLAHCEDESVLGTEFYVMEKLNGIIPRQNLPKGLNVGTQQAKTLCTNVIDCLIELHKVDVDAANLNHLGKGEGYTQRQIDGWSQRYTQAKTWNVPSGKKVMAWLQTHKPTQETICLTHNDFRFDNVVLDQDDISTVNGVLDWELATLGNPLMDLGNTLAYWVEADDDFLAQMTRRQPTHLDGMLTRKQVVEYYCDKMDITIDDFRFYEVFGLFRLAGIVQQIYYRYHHKQTRNPAFKQFWIFSHYLMWRCHRTMKQQG